MAHAVTSAGRVDVLADPSALADAAAALVADHAGRASVARGRFVLALSGGSTPRVLYERVAERRDLDWTRGHVVWGDERCVAPDDAASNYRMAREALLDHVAIPAAHVHRIRGEATPEVEAQRYEAELRALVPDGAIDLVLLGLGADGHTASLFPDDPASTDGRWVRAVSFVDARGPRITLTDTALEAARALAFLVAGAGKATVVAAVLGGSEDPSPLPARRVARRGRDVRWLLDREAAAAILTDLGSVTTEP
jgi:6-phosphogluconolactonase